MKGLMNGISETQACAGSMGCGFSRRRLVKSSFLGLFATMMVVAPFEAFAARPSGAIKLSKSKLSKKSGFYCGNVKKASWIPGKVLPGGYFYPHQAERATLSKQLKKAPKSKRSKIQKQIATLDRFIAKRSGQCRGGGDTKALRFNFSGAVGLTLKNNVGTQSLAVKAIGDISGLESPSSNLNKVDSAGQQSEVVTTGSAVIRQFLIPPNNKLYLLFASGTNLGDTSKAGDCLLAEVSKATGTATCIESELSSIITVETNSYWAKNNSIQFDFSGAIYYLGIKSNGRVVLRRNSEGTATDLINDNISVSDFVVLGDGRVVLSGSTLSTNTTWVRRISATGGITNLYLRNTYFLRLFPDANVYFGGLDGIGGAGAGVGRYLSETDLIDARPYIAHDSANPYFPISQVCDDMLNPAGFCGGVGALVKSFYETANGEVYAIGNANTGTGTLMRYYPTVARVPTVVSAALVFQGVGNNLVVAGLNSTNKNIVTLLNTIDGSETELIGATNEIEVYHLNYLAADNKLMFDGLRFSDNKYVIGQYDLNTMTFSTSPIGDTKLVDFQTF